jgi:hypothetical protein
MRNNARRSQVVPRRKRKMSESVVKGGPRVVYVPVQEKSPEKLLAWSTFVSDVHSAQSGADVLKATLAFAIVDKAQGAFAFNRAKKVFEKMGRLQEERWSVGYGKQNLKQKQEFYAEYYNPNVDLEELKVAAITPTGGHKPVDTPRPSAVTASPSVPVAKSTAKAAAAAVTVVISSPGEDKIGKEHRKRKAPEPSSSSGGHAPSISAPILKAVETPAVDLERQRTERSRQLAADLSSNLFKDLKKTKQKELKKEWFELLVAK